MKNFNRFLVTVIFISLFSSLAFGESQVHYVFMMIDSTFHPAAILESKVPNQGIPDTAEVLAAANKTSHWRNAHLNDKPQGMVWLAYESPGDPGTIIFVSNTMPAVSLLNLNIDAMCNSCVNSYGFHGMKIPENLVRDTVILIPYSGLENRFGLGVSITDQERWDVIKNLPQMEMDAQSSTVFILKMDSQFPSVEGIKYIAYYSFEIPGANLRSTLRPSSFIPEVDTRYLANGKEIPLTSPIHSWSGLRSQSIMPNR